MTELLNAEAAFTWAMEPNPIAIEKEKTEMRRTMKKMTDIGYKELLTRISSVPVSDIPKDFNLVELRAWLVGYSQAIDTVKKVVEELKEGRE